MEWDSGKVKEGGMKGKYGTGTGDDCAQEGKGAG